MCLPASDPPVYCTVAKDLSLSLCLQVLKNKHPEVYRAWGRHVRVFSDGEGSGPVIGSQLPAGTIMMNGRPEGAGCAFEVQYFFRHHRLGSFINSASQEAEVNVKAVKIPGSYGKWNYTDELEQVFEYRQLYVATKDIKPGEEILHKYTFDGAEGEAIGGGEGDGAEGEPMGGGEGEWFRITGVTHSAVKTLNEAECRSSRYTRPLNPFSSVQIAVEYLLGLKGEFPVFVCGYEFAKANCNPHLSGKDLEAKTRYYSVVVDFGGITLVCSSHSSYPNAPPYCFRIVGLNRYNVIRDQNMQNLETGWSRWKQLSRAQYEAGMRLIGKQQYGFHTGTGVTYEILEAIDVYNQCLYLQPSRSPGIAAYGVSEYMRGGQIWQGQRSQSDLEKAGFVFVT